MSKDFSKGKIGAIVTAGPNKVRVMNCLDTDLIDHFKQQVNSAGGGNYKSLINEALRQYVQGDK